VQGDIVSIEEARTADAPESQGEGEDGHGAEEAEGPFAHLDDGTGVFRIDLGQFYIQRARYKEESWRATRGMYVLLLAVVNVENDVDHPAFCYVMKDLSDSPDRMAMWWCELLDRPGQIDR